jgi:hypothetical protein
MKTKVVNEKLITMKLRQDELDLIKESLRANVYVQENIAPLNDGIQRQVRDNLIRLSNLINKCEMFSI